jgi:predicted metal-dependent hydrolase
VESIEIDGSNYSIREVLSSNKHATARLKGNNIIISLPSRWQPSDRERVKSNLKKRAIKSIEAGRWNTEIGKKMTFENGQRLVVLGKEFEIVFLESDMFKVEINGRKVVIATEGHSDKIDVIAKLVRRKISQAVMPELVELVGSINQKYFGSKISTIKIRDSVSRWGSCSAEGAISLNFRLLMMPQEILDYVIVHELAHTKIRNHGPKFWNLVGTAIPDHKEKRKWLRKNGWSTNITRAEPLEEPY